VVAWDGTPLATTFTSSGSLDATLPAALIGGSGNHDVTVSSPAPGGGTTAAFVVVVTNPVAAITSATPSSLLAGTAQSSRSSGTSFLPSSVVTVNGSTTGVTVTSLTSTSIGLTLAASLVPTSTTLSVVVSNPAPGGGASAPFALVVEHPTPSLAAVTPTTFVSTAPPSTLAITGSGFDAASEVRWDGTALPTTFVDGGNLTATLSPSAIGGAGPHAVTVFNPSPIGGTSAPITVTVVNTAPVLNVVTPSSAVAGQSSVAITCTGSNFTPTSTVKFDGVPVPTTFNSTTSLSAALTSAELQVAGAHVITVETPAPGGGISASSPFSVLAPSVFSMSPIVTNVGGSSVTLNFTAFYIGPQTVVYADGVALPTTLLGTASVRAVLPANFPALSREGGIAINLVNTLQAASPSKVLQVGTGLNTGIINHYPVPEPIPPSTTFSLDIEGGTPDAPFSIFYDFTNPLPVTNFPTPADGQVLALSAAGLGVIIDGLGVVGPPIPGLTLAPTPTTVPVPPNAPTPGSFKLPGIVTPPTPFGTRITIQCVYIDPFAPSGLKFFVGTLPREHLIGIGRRAPARRPLAGAFRRPGARPRFPCSRRRIRPCIDWAWCSHSWWRSPSTARLRRSRG
jgi:hypothetical protein